MSIQHDPNAPPVAGPPSRDREQINRALAGLLEISHLVGSVMMLDDILDRIVQITSRLMDVPVCTIYLLNEDGRLVLRSNVGFEPELKGEVSFGPQEGIVGWVAGRGQTLALEDSLPDPRYRPMPSTIEKGCRAYLCSPLRIQDEVIGVMTARKTRVYRFTADDILFFETVCKQVAIVIEKARMYEEKLEAERLAAVAISLSGVAHYIKNVLMTMKGGEYLVERGIEGGDVKRVGEGWSVLRRANRKIRSLVENILSYCSKAEPRLRQVDLNSMIGDMVQTMTETARERGVEIHARLDPRVGQLWIDPESIYDALLNLVTNAIEAVPEGRPGRVQVRTERLGDRNQVLTEVADNGTGIPAEARDKIFNLFFSTKGEKGTGIGLSATRKIVEAHGGSIELESRQGEGTTFQVWLPVNPADRTDAGAIAGGG
jgi:signal transduction histidine kinase